jgi:hypothetical protein
VPEEVKEVIRSGQEIEYKRLKQMDKQRLKDIIRLIHRYQFASVLFPTSFYKSLNKELGSKGFNNFILFYNYTFKKKYEFVKYFAEKKFFNPPADGKVVSFIKGDENLFYGGGSLPSYAYLGFLLNFLYITILLWDIRRVGKRIVPAPVEAVQPGATDEVSTESGKAVLHYFREPAEREAVFSYYLSQPNALCLEAFRVESILFLSGSEVLDSFCDLARLTPSQRDQAKAYYGLVSGKLPESSLSGQPGARSIRVTGELHLDAARACVKLASFSQIASEEPGAKALVVFKEFFKERSREFDSAFIPLLEELERQGFRLVYLSCNTPHSRYESGNLAGYLEDMSANGTPIPWKYDRVSLR